MPPLTASPLICAVKRSPRLLPEKVTALTRQSPSSAPISTSRDAMWTRRPGRMPGDRKTSASTPLSVTVGTPISPLSASKDWTEPIHPSPGTVSSTPLVMLQ